MLVCEMFSKYRRLSPGSLTKGPICGPLYVAEFSTTNCVLRILGVKSIEWWHDESEIQLGKVLYHETLFHTQQLWETLHKIISRMCVQGVYETWVLWLGLSRLPPRIPHNVYVDFPESENVWNVKSFGVQIAFPPSGPKKMKEETKWRLKTSYIWFNFGRS